MQSSPNGTVKNLTYLDQGSNDINNFLYLLKYRKVNRIVFEFLGHLATMHPIFGILNLHSYSITHFIFLCEP